MKAIDRCVSASGSTLCRAPFARLCAGALLAILLCACSGNNHPRGLSSPAAGGGAGTATAAVPTGVAGTPGRASASTSSPAAAQATPAQTDSRAETVKLAFDVLMDRYYMPLGSAALLNAAWQGAFGAGGAASVPAPTLRGDRSADWAAFDAQYEQLYSRASSRVSGTALAFAATKGMLDSLHDDHTYFLSPADFKQRLAEDENGDTFTGIGVTLSASAPLVVEFVLPGSPAAKAGLRQNDRVTSINGKDVAGVSAQAAADLLKGDAGTTVQLGYRRGQATEQTVALMRTQLTQSPLAWRMLPDGVGYISLSGFADADTRYNGDYNVSEELDLALQGFEQQGVKGWIFDVRGNPGGSSQTLSEVAGRFLAAGNVLTSKDRTGALTAEPVDGHLFPEQRPLALLINGNSGSSSELLAATMKEYGRAHLVGAKTAGAVNGGYVALLPDGAAFQYTVVEALSGRLRVPLDHNGVTPDDAVPGSGTQSAVLQGGTDGQLDRADQWVVQQAAQRPLLAATPAAAGDALPETQVRSTLQPFAPALTDVPDGPARSRLGYLVLSHPDELAIGIAADTTDPEAFANAVRARHWQGSYQEFFGSSLPQPYIVTIDLYKDAAGAHAAVTTDDFSTGLKGAPSPVTLGDETVAYQGFGIADGSDQIVWRRGRLVFTVQYSAAPGAATFAPAVELARVIDAHAAARPAP